MCSTWCLRQSLIDHAEANPASRRSLVFVEYNVSEKPLRGSTLIPLNEIKNKFTRRFSTPIRFSRSRRMRLILEGIACDGHGCPNILQELL
jgi:hypothetical protein